jgi:hypothetical protein
VTVAGGQGSAGEKKRKNKEGGLEVKEKKKKNSDAA